MKFNVTLLIIVLFGLKINAQSVIPWSKDRKLVWSDFKGTPNEEVFAYAQAAYKIEIIPSDVLIDTENNIQDYKKLSIQTNFYTKSSWVTDKSDYLLAHEQLHFDIAELFARKIRVAFENLKKQKVATFDAYINAYKKLWVECRKMQKEYDKKTNHGLKVKENKEWINKVNLQSKITESQ
jgi:predicted secreted Zn-dependent protease